MQQCLPLLFLILIWTVLPSSLATSNPLSISSANINFRDYRDTLTNLSQIDMPNDFKLNLVVTFPSQQPEEAFFYGGIMALKEVALHDFNGDIPIQRFRTRNFPDMEVRLASSDNGPLPTKYAVWALTLALYFIDYLNVWETSIWSMEWQGNAIGGIALGDPTTLSQLFESDSSGTEETPQNLVVSDGPANDTNATNGTTIPGQPDDTDPVTLDVSYGRSLDKSAVFLTIIAALSDAAVKPADSRVTGTWSSSFSNYHCEFHTEELTPVRTSPPFYTFRWLIESLGKAIQVFVLYNRYQELSMRVKVNNIVVAQSSFEYKLDANL